MSLDRLTKVTGAGIASDHNLVGNNAIFTGVTTAGTSFNVGVSTFHSTLAEVHNIKSTGIITATGGSFSGNVTAVDGTFTGNVSIGGTLTYEDVTNIDSVGIITARSGLVSPYADVDDFLDVGNNIKLGNAGVITATSFVGSGAALTGIDATAIKDTSGNVKIQAQASGAIHSGVSTFQDLDVDGHTNLDNVSIAGVTTVANDTRLIIGSNADNRIPFKIKQNTSASNHNQIDSRYTYFYSHAIRFYDQDSTSQQVAYFWNNQIGLYAYGSEKLRVTGSAVEILNGNLSVSRDLDVDGHTNLDNVSIAGIVTALNFVKTDGTTVGGAMTGYNNDPGENNVTTFIAGRGAGNNIQLQNSDGQSAHGNVLIGDGAGKAAQNQYDYNVSIGSYANYNLRDGSYNVAIGYGANRNVSTQVSSNTIAIGYETLINFVGGGTAVTNGRNTVVGHAAAGTLVSGGNNLVLGMSADVSSANISNEITLGNTSINHLRVPGIGVSFSAGGAVISGVCTATSFAGDGSALTGISAGTSLSGSTNNTVCTVTGANAIQGESNVQIDSNGRLLIGTTTEGHAAADNLTVADTGNSGITIRSGTSNNGALYFSDGTSGSAEYKGAVRYSHSDNALDFYTNGSTRLLIDSSGRLQIGHTAGIVGGRVEVHATTAETQITINESSDSGTGPALYLNRTRGSDLSSPTPIQNGNYMGSIHFGSYDTNSYEKGASIEARADGQTWADGDCPTRLQFLTTPDGSTTPTERMRIHNGGQVSIGNASYTTQVHDYQLVVTPNISDNSKAGLGVLIDGEHGTSGGASADSISLRVKNTNTWNNATKQYAGYFEVGQQLLQPQVGVYSQATGLYSTQRCYEAVLNKNLAAVTDGIAYYSNVVPTNSGGAVYHFFGQDNGSTKIYIEQDGDIKNSNNSYGSTSDLKLKENIVDANSQLNDIKSIKIRNYNFKESTGYNTHKQIGVVAQELEASGLNGLVETNPDELYIAGDEIPNGKNIGDVKEKGYKTVKYSVLYMKAIKALQEAIAKIETLEAKVSALEG